jgi:hypothetical protein
LISLWATFEGVLTYEIERSVSLTVTRLSIIWKYEGYKDFHVFVQLIEFDRGFGWDKIKLEEYYQGYANQLCIYTGPIKNTWLLHDGTVFMTELELDFTQRNGVLSLSISEGVRDDHTKGPEWISLNR